MTYPSVLNTTEMLNSSGCLNYTFLNDSENCNSTSNSTKASELLFYSLTYRIVGTVFLLPILIVGIFGNVMVVTVVAKTRSMRSPTNCYLVSLAIADILALATSVPNEVLALYLVGDQWVYGQVGCILFIFLQYLGVNISALSITAFTIERYIAICQPMKAHAICTISRAKKIIYIVWIFGTLYCSQWLFMVTTKPLKYAQLETLETCVFRFQRERYFIYFADIMLFYVIPLLLCVVLYGMIARVLLFSDITNSFGKCDNGKNNWDSKKCTTAANPKVQVVKMLAVVVAVFAIFWMPYRGLVVYNSIASTPYMNLWFLMFCKTMVYINSAINPILYSAMSIKFRRAFRRVLSCGDKNQILSTVRSRNGGHMTCILSRGATDSTSV